jgi:putative hydrolase of the HAD superfamily
MASERTSAFAVLLDAHGTLLALEPPAPLLRAELARRHGIEITDRQAAHAIGAEIAYYRAHHHSARDADSLAALRAACTEVLRDALPPAARSVQSLTDVLLSSLRFTPFPDVPPALQAARSARIGLVVVSDWDVSLHQVLRQTGLAPLLDGAVTSAEVGVTKPGRELFERGLALAGVEAGHAVHVGDSIERDVEGARAAGIEPILIRRAGGPAPPGVRSISALTELLGGGF